MRIVFMGTPAFAVPSLEGLVRAGHEVVGVVCQPDAAAGRNSKEPAAPPVKQLALRLGLPVFQPKGLKSEKNQEPLRLWNPELIVVVAYGKILPKAVLELPPRKCINVHGSLLPALRGAAPIQWAVARGLKTTGITTMLMDEGMDTGPMLLQRETRIGEQETAAELSERLAQIGAGLLLETLALWEKDQLRACPQPEEGVSYAPILQKEDGRLAWTMPADELASRIRGFWPWPGSTCLTPEGKPLKIHRARATEGSGPPGLLLEVRPDGIVVATAKGALLLQEIQPESRKRMDAAEFARGARLKPGVVFA